MLIRSVEKFLRRHRIAATHFGRLATRDPRFVLDLRKGREPRPATVSRVSDYLERIQTEGGH